MRGVAWWLTFSVVMHVAAAQAEPTTICGVLARETYKTPAAALKRWGVRSEHLDLIVPKSLRDKTVERYVLVTQSRISAAPLKIYASWWFCVTGRVLRAYQAEDHEYGVLQADAYEIDQTSAERGQE